MGVGGQSVGTDEASRVSATPILAPTWYPSATSNAAPNLGTSSPLDEVEARDALSKYTGGGRGGRD